MNNKVSKFKLQDIRRNVLSRERKSEWGRSGIYAIINLINDHTYIGQSRNIGKRWRKHKNDLNSGSHYNQHLQYAWTKYRPASFDFGVLEICNQEDLNVREQYWINRLEPEYNIVLDVLNFSLYTGEKTSLGTYQNEGESFTRPEWHLWVYGGKRQQCRN